MLPDLVGNDVPALVFVRSRLTSALPVTWVNGAAGGTRTPDLLVRSQLLYPLSYSRIRLFRSQMLYPLSYERLF
jgi:hypothetical protein